MSGGTERLREALNEIEMLVNSLKASNFGLMRGSIRKQVKLAREAALADSVVTDAHTVRELRASTGDAVALPEATVLQGLQEGAQIANHSKTRNHVMREAWEAALAARHEPSVPSVDELAAEIRRIDGGHDKGAGAIAEELTEWLRARAALAGEPK